MNYKTPTAKIAVVSAGILALASVGTTYAAHRMPGDAQRLSPEVHAQMKSAIEQNDYSGFMQTLEEQGLTQMSEHMTEERFASMQEHMQNGDFGKRAHEFGRMHPLISPEAMDEVRTAIQENNFEAFKSAVESGLTQEHFNTIVEHYNQQEQAE